MKNITSSKLIVLFAIFLITFGNVAFFSNVTDVYSVSLNNIAFLCSLAFVFGSVPVLLFSLVCFKHTIKPVLIAVLLLSSFASYFMDSYNVIINDEMIQNIVKTDAVEIMDLITFKLAMYVILLGIIPSIFIYKVNIIYADIKKELISRLKLFFLTSVLVVLTILVFGSYYASFLREHKPLRFYANPTYYIYSTLKYIGGNIITIPLPLKAVGEDAKIPLTDLHRELIIFIVGETARSDRFSLNGYTRETNPLLKNENVISFTNFWSCGTSTAVSVPCMFSIYGQSRYSDAKAEATENLLDVLKHAGVNVLWLENNSSSKGVAERIQHENYKKPALNPVCDSECRDIGMLANIQTYIDEHQHGDIFIVLHQMGNHGPAYYKRYPPGFEKFTPACQTSQLENCSDVEITNAYDNAILYTDYFLSEVIKLLKNNNAGFESAMFYVSDHGESLGEHGVYLHGMPDIIAPDAQKHVPAIMWFGNNFDEINMESLMTKSDRKYTHDNIFHTVLGLMEIETSLYDKEKDILYSTAK